MTTTPKLTSWVLDGTEFDLSRTWIDVYGGRWDWTGLTAGDGEPLMQHGTHQPMALSLVYWTYGPLIPAPRAVTQAERYAAITACPAEAETPAPTPRTFAVILNRLRRRPA